MPDFDIFEGMTSISAVIKSIQNGSSDRRIIKILYNEDRFSKKFREIQFLKHTAHSLGFEIISTTSAEIDAMTSGTTHGGIIAICTPRSFPELNVKNLTNGGFYALIEGVEDPYNFGYSVRSLYAAGVDGIILPPRNWMEIAGTVARSSAGTSELANIYIADPLDAVNSFKSIGFEIVCAEIRDSESLYDHTFSDSVLLVVGGEKRGISRKILELADTNVRIEYGREFLGSLPSASAISVISFEILRQKRNKS